VEVCSAAEGSVGRRHWGKRRRAMPVEKRMNFLRRRLPGGGSCL
jgi:hypothetical protein